MNKNKNKIIVIIGTAFVVIFVAVNLIFGKPAGSHERKVNEYSSQNQASEIITVITEAPTETTTIPITTIKVPTTTTIKTEIPEKEPELVEKYTEMDVPEGDTSFFTYMDGGAVKNTHSEQYKLLKQCYVDVNGLYRYGEDYVVAMGSYYSTTIRQRFRVTLDNGNVFTVILGDCKADIHTDALHQYKPAGYGSKNVIEFIVDTDNLSDFTRIMGNIGTYEFFNSGIKSIERIDTNV